MSKRFVFCRRARMLFLECNVFECVSKGRGDVEVVLIFLRTKKILGMFESGCVKFYHVTFDIHGGESKISKYCMTSNKRMRRQLVIFYNVRRRFSESKLMGRYNIL